jgi:hypothetical protein
VANDWRGFNGIRVPTDPAARRIELRGAPYDDTLEQVMASYDAMLAQMARLKKGDRLTFVSGGDFIEGQKQTPPVRVRVSQRIEHPATGEVTLYFRSATGRFRKRRARRMAGK